MAITQINLTKPDIKPREPSINLSGFGDLAKVIKAEARQLKHLPDGLEINSKIDPNNYMASYGRKPLLISFERTDKPVEKASDKDPEDKRPPLSFSSTSPQVLRMDEEADKGLKALLDKNLPKGNIKLINKVLEEKELNVKITDPNIAQRITNSLMDQRLESARASKNNAINYGDLVQAPLTKDEIIKNLDKVQSIIDTASNNTNGMNRKAATELAASPAMF